MATLNYTVDRGETWERLVIIKDRRTHRKRVPTEVAASLRIPSGVNAGDYVIPTEINSEGGVSLYLTPGNTEWLEVGEYLWDMVVTISQSALLTSTPLEEVVAVKGTLTVIEYNNITPLASDNDPTPLEQVE